MRSNGLEDDPAWQSQPLRRFHRIMHALKTLPEAAIAFKARGPQPDWFHV
jgi:hypothetical protein